MNGVNASNSLKKGGDEENYYYHELSKRESYVCKQCNFEEPLQYYFLLTFALLEFILPTSLSSSQQLQCSRNKLYNNHTFQSCNKSYMFMCRHVNNTQCTRQTGTLFTSSLGVNSK